LKSLASLGPNPLAPADRWEPFLLLTAESLPPDITVLLPGCLIVPTSDVTLGPVTMPGVSGPYTQRLTWWHLPHATKGGLMELLSTARLGRA
jgi:hypothetical protein